MKRIVCAVIASVALMGAAEAAVVARGRAVATPTSLNNKPSAVPYSPTQSPVVTAIQNNPNPVIRNQLLTQLQPLTPLSAR